MKSVCVLLLSLSLQLGTLVNSQDPVIVGGRDARAGEYPYQLLLQYNGEFTCGASLSTVMGVQVVITAAHCLHNRPHSRFTVVAGVLNWNSTSGSEQTRRLSRAVLHSEYNPRNIENDIAILFLERPFQLNSNVGTIPLPNPYQATSGNVIITGWGYRNFWRTVEAYHLQTITLPVISDSVCQNKYYVYYSSLLCIGHDSNNQGTCSGDSGGPARSQSGYLVGIVSFGTSLGCGLRDYPDAFTEVSYFVDWIGQQVMSQG